jgi:hypothetical protein
MIKNQINLTIVLFCTFLISITMMSFKTIDFKSHSKNNSSAMIPEADATVKKKIRFAIRHSNDNDPNTPPCVCPDCKIPTCPCPLGLCATYGITLNSNTLTQLDLDLQNSNELGRADIWILSNNNQAVIKFDQETGYFGNSNSQNKIIEINNNIILPQDLCTELGFNNISITQGTFDLVIEPNVPFGYIVVNVTAN